MTDLGSIPARAGEPFRCDLVLDECPPRVYPRACGGTGHYGAVGPFWTLGLSPRVRGNPAPEVPRQRHNRGLSPRVRGNPPKNSALTF